MHGKVFRMKARLSPLTNLWMSNYVISSEGARRVLKIARGYDTFGAWEMFDVFMLSKLYGVSHMGGFVGFTVEENELATICGGLCYDSGKGSVVKDCGKARHAICNR